MQLLPPPTNLLLLLLMPQRPQPPTQQTDRHSLGFGALGVVHAPCAAALVPAHCARHSFVYVMPSSPHTSLTIVSHLQAIGSLTSRLTCLAVVLSMLPAVLLSGQGPVLSMRAPAHFASQMFAYVLRSLLHTGAYSFAHAQGAFEAGVAVVAAWLPLPLVVAVTWPPVAGGLHSPTYAT